MENVETGHNQRMYPVCARILRAHPATLLRVLRTTLLFIFLAPSLSGCARVAPYERGTLARKDMEMGKDPDLAAGEEHGLAYREGSSGGGDAKGGGCGCN